MDIPKLNIIKSSDYTINVKFGTDGSYIEFRNKDIKRIKDLSETKDDKIIEYLYICNGFDKYILKCPIHTDNKECERYNCIISNTYIDPKYKI